MRRRSGRISLLLVAIVALGIAMVAGLPLGALAIAVAMPLVGIYGLAVTVGAQDTAKPLLKPIAALVGFGVFAPAFQTMLLVALRQADWRLIGVVATGLVCLLTCVGLLVLFGKALALKLPDQVHRRRMVRERAPLLDLDEARRAPARGRTQRAGDDDLHLFGGRDGS